MNRGAPAELCQCEGAAAGIRNAWAALRDVAELINAPAPMPAAVSCIAWLLTRDDRRSMVKHYYAESGCGEETSRMVMDHLRQNGWAESRPVPTDRRVVRLFPTKKLQEALHDR